MGTRETNSWERKGAARTRGQRLSPRAVEEGGEQGVFEPSEKELIHSVFEFTDTSVKNVMIPAPQMVTIRLSMSVDEVRAIVSEEKFSRYPVIGRDVNDVRGFLYAKDFYNILLAAAVAAGTPPESVERAGERLQALRARDPDGEFLLLLGGTVGGLRGIEDGDDAVLFQAQASFDGCFYPSVQSTLRKGSLLEVLWVTRVETE